MWRGTRWVRIFPIFRIVYFDFWEGKLTILWSWANDDKAVTSFEASEAIASLKIPSFFKKMNDLQRCLVYSFILILPKVVSSCSNRIIASLFHICYCTSEFTQHQTVYVPHLVTLFHYVVIHVTCLHWRHFLYEMKYIYLAEKRVLPKK